jgi:signal transduction histidine kinase
MARSQPAKILVVDDNDANLLAVEAILSPLGHELVNAHSGEDALRHLLAEEFSLILLDVQMPGLDGFQTAQLIRAREASRETAIIFLTAEKGTDELVHKGYALGAVDYLIKPLAPEILRAKVQLLIERQQATHALRRSEASLRNIMEDSGDGLVVTTGDGDVVFLNSSAADMFGRSKQELLGGLFGFPVVAKETAELEITSPRGRTLCIEMRASETCWLGERAHLVSLRDVTERKRVAEELRLRDEELQRANRSLTDRNAEIQNFYHTLSHELKTPLTSAREFLCIVIDGLAGPLNKTQSEYLDVAKESCDQLRLYVNDLLDVTRLETGKMSIEFEKRSVAALLERVVAMLSPAAAGKGIALSCDCQPDMPDVPMDEQRILQVLSNLTTNAMKFTREGGTIRLSVSQDSTDPECVQVSVRDTGVGIPKEHLERVFNRLYQATSDDARTESRSGLGLGLFICQELVALHGGRIWVESTPGEGSTFTFTLPKRRAPTGAYVLVVDDDAVLANALHDFLGEAGYRVSIAGGGAEALGLVRQRRPAVIILDLRMAGMDGPDTMREIRKQDTWIPVIVHTGYPDGDMMSRMLEFSPFTVLAKPSPPEAILDAVRDAESRVRRTRK